jgi:spermidine synthase
MNPPASQPRLNANEHEFFRPARNQPHRKMIKQAEPGTAARAIGVLLRIAVCLLVVGTSFGCACASASMIFETTSPYHHVRVTEDEGMRILRFDDATETRMSIQDPLKGHFEYTEFFHLSWLWNTNLSKVLMVGLGGASAQRSFEHYYPRVTVESVEIDPVVVQVARNYFQYQESDRQKIHTEDGRVFLRRSTGRYDLIILDAYVSGRYGSSIPQHLATREFFELVRDHLSTNGIVAYNVIGTLSDWHADIVGALYRTLKSVFPQVYLFPAKSSLNVVLLATRAGVKADLNALRQRANLLVQTKQVNLPGFRERLESFQPLPPASAARSPVLTDDYAPVEGLAATGGR